MMAARRQRGSSKSAGGPAKQAGTLAEKQQLRGSQLFIPCNWSTLAFRLRFYVPQCTNNMV